MSEELLTIQEHNIIYDLGQLAEQFARIVGPGPLSHDYTEAVFHIHALQNMVMAQAAARAFPKTYRLMGQTL